MFRRTVLSAAFVLALPLAAAAQTAPSAPAAPVTPGAPAAGAPRPAHGLRAMLAGLNLSADQQTQVNAILKNYHGINKGVTDKATRRANHQKELQEIMGVLTPDQQSQLKARMAAAHHHPQPPPAQ